MSVASQEASYRISGRYGEAFYLDPSGANQPLKIMEATAVSFTKVIGVEDVPLSGNRTGSKDSGEEPGTGSMTVNQIDNWWQNIVLKALNPNLAARRAARDAGVRIARTFTLQVWLDDPEALGVIGYQLDEVRLSQIDEGFDFGQTVTARELPFRYETLTPISTFQRLGNQVDPNTGLPAIVYTERIGSKPG